MYTGIVHRDANGIFWFDDLPVRGPEDLPTGKAWAGTLWYVPDGIRTAEWAKLMRPGDFAFGPRHGDVMGVSFRVGPKSRMRVVRASSWGVQDRDPNAAARELDWLMVEAAAADLPIRTSIASTAVQLYLQRFDGSPGHPAIRQLPSRWRGLAHAALHGGPIAVLRGGADYAVQVDVHRAYLAALREEMPIVGRGEDGRVVGGWWTDEDLRWARVRRHFGFVDCRVRVAGDLHDPEGLPPLPVHVGTGIVFPTGTFRGVWTIAQVREAEERGEVEVLEVYQYAFSNRRQPIFAELADFFDQLPAPLAKRLYTRFWGKFGMRGGYVAEVRDKPVDGEIPSGGMWWRYEGIALGDTAAPATYRPDIAAFVATFNHRRVIETARGLAPGSTVAVHVDAIWTTDVVVARGLVRQPGPDGIPPKPRAGDWKVKREGRLRFYGVGAYNHDGHLAASGYDPLVHGPLTEERLRRWVGAGEAVRRRMLLDARAWKGDPARDAGATSHPPRLEQDVSAPSPAEGPSVYDPIWTPSGWMRQPADEAPQEPPAP